METPHTDRTSADGWCKGGWKTEPGGEGEGTHRRESLLFVGAAGVRLALVVKCFADWWVTTVEPWED